MITVVQPKEVVAKLWGNQKVNENETYRLMRYVLRVDYDGKVMLHNVVTGQLIVLNEDEKSHIDKLPIKYETWMNNLVADHYLVKDQFDEHMFVVNMREILRKMDDIQNKSSIVHYTILPTTACNAHCYYCYQHGLKTMTMSMETAEDVVSFIKKYSQGDRIWIRWFGGEPTIATSTIDRICAGLNANSIDFVSRMTTNGYLMDNELIEKMKCDWHLEQIMISLDGSEGNYNATKSFGEVCDNPYKRVFRNVRLLLEHNVHVSLRMNFNKRNYLDFGQLLKDVHDSFGNDPLLEVRPHYIIPNNRSNDMPAYLEYEQWCEEKIVELNEMSREKGLYHKKYPLPSLKYKGCLAASDRAVVILPDGSLVSCPDLLNEGQVKGDIWKGITDKENDKSWKQFGDFDRCRDCLFFPKCSIAANCDGGGFCSFFIEYKEQYRKTVIDTVRSFL